MSTKLNFKVTQLHLSNWYKSALKGESPASKDPQTQKIIEHSLPFAKSIGDGVTFTLSKKGTASWILRYRFAGRSRELTIGNYPDISLSEARRRASEHRASIDAGGDPAHDKRKTKIRTSNEWTVNELIEDYRSKVLKDLSKSTITSYSRSLLRVKRKLGGYLISNVESLDISLLIESAHNTWSESNMLLIATKMLFRHAVGKRLISSNPCLGVELRAIIGKRPTVKKRLMLSADELQILLNASMSRENILAVKVLLATAVRTDELRNAKWEHVDLNKKIWSVPATKTGTATQIPLAPVVVTWFNELKSLSKNSNFVLPARKIIRTTRLGCDAPINPNTIGAAIQFWFTTHIPNVRRFTPHDLRSTAKSHMRALGIDSDITEMCLNHKLKGVQGIYDVHTYFKERKVALEKWGELLQRIQNGTHLEKANPFLEAKLRSATN